MNRIIFIFLQNEKMCTFTRGNGDVPFKKYDTAFICVPDNQKYKLANFCLKNIMDLE